MFHLAKPSECPTVICILGGTGTGKSTMVNRLLEANVSAASFRRTFTAGPVAIVEILPRCRRGGWGLGMWRRIKVSCLCGGRPMCWWW